jgi:hypothetical protein
MSDNKNAIIVLPTNKGARIFREGNLFYNRTIYIAYAIKYNGEPKPAEGGTKPFGNVPSAKVI